MNTPNPNSAGVKTLLAGMAAETDELQRALAAPVAETIAAWSTQQYVLAAHQKLADTAGTQRWDVLRALVHDLSLLRRGDHSAARLQLDRDFGGRNISEQNLSEWKTGGYRDWQVRQESLAQARGLAAGATELAEATDNRLTDHLATVLASKYAVALLGWNGEPTEEFRRELGALRSLCQDIVGLRRGDHGRVRLNMQQEQLDRERGKDEENQPESN